MTKFRFPLEFVEGIGPAYAAALKNAGLHTCLDLLKAGTTRSGREQVSHKSGLPGTLIMKWVNHVDLYRVRGIGSEYADLLEAAGVDTVAELAQRSPSHLYAALIEVYNEKQPVRQMPTQAQVEDWVRRAKRLPRAVEY
jgi:predicted flap endonuclease-1-like 5' DNA nuclease